MEISLKSKNWQEAIDITENIEDFVKGQEGKAVLLFCPHTTAGITINEGYDKNVMKDVLEIIDELTPRLDFLHKEGNSPAHAKSSLVGNYLLIPIEEGRLKLGKWQKIFFLEFDGPKERKININIL